MRFIFLTSSSNLSGGTRQAMYLAQGLIAQGHRVTFFVPHDAQITSIDNTIEWRNLPEKHALWRDFIEAALPPEGEPCIAHAFHNKAQKLLTWWSLAWKKRGIICVGYRGVIYRPNNPLPYWSPGMDAFVVNSRACGRVLRSVGCPKRKIQVVYNGVPDKRTAATTPPEEIRQSLGIPNNALVLGTVAGNKPVKGVDVLLKAFAQADVDAHLVAIGVKEALWRDKRTELGLDGRAHLIGRIENVADYLQIFDAFVLPSRSESLPNVIIEAFGFGLPIVASSVGGVPEIVTDNGLLVPPAKVTPLAGALRRICEDDAARKRWAEASLKHAPEFSLEKKVERSIEVYNLLLARRGYPTI